jgi:hypothetical protein
LAIATSALTAGCSDPRCEETAYQTFRDYRLGISTSPEESLQYFSDSVLSEWLGGIVFSNFPENLELVHLVRSNVLFGSSINQLHGFDVTSESRNSCILTLDYSSEDGEELIHLGLTYKRVDDRYAIDFFEYDHSDKNQVPDLVIEDFSPFQPPDGFREELDDQQ